MPHLARDRFAVASSHAADVRGAVCFSLTRRSHFAVGRRIACAVALCMGAWFPIAAAEEPQSNAGGARRVITSGGEFWTMSEAEKQRSHAIRLELVVYYYDPAWKLMWTESRGAPAFLPVAGAELPIQSGQRVLVEGTAVPAIGITGETVKVTVLAERATPAPVSTKGAIAAINRWDARWTSVEGYVCQQQEIDPTHLLVTILCEGRLVTARVLLGITEPVPQLVNRRVRVNGVYVGHGDLSGKLQNINLWVPRRSEIEVFGVIDDDARFKLPRSAIEQLGAKPEEWVRISGEVRAYEPGQALTLRDETGQVVIVTEQPVALQPGDLVEVVGRPSGKDFDVTLHEPLFRRMDPGPDAAAATAEPAVKPFLKLRLVEQVMELRPSDAARRFPVWIKGVVTWKHPTSAYFFLQDTSGGILVRNRTATDPNLQVGATFWVTGVSTYGAFAPEVEAEQLRRDGDMILPVPRPVTFEQALTGTEEGRRVEIRGYLRQVEREGEWLRLDVTTGTGEFAAFAPLDAALEVHVGALVRVAGVCVATANAQRQLTGVQLWLDSSGAVQVEQAAPADPFVAPVQTIASLRQFLGVKALHHRVRVAGAVLLQQPGRFLYLQDRDAGLLVLSRATTPLVPGEWVEVVGIPGREGSRLVLREAVWRRWGAGVTPEALVLDADSALDPEVDGRLVRARARLHQVIRDPAGVRLVLTFDKGTFEAVLDRPRADLPREGSLIELTGVHILEYDEYRRPRAFQLHLRSPEDLRVLEVPSRWTARRALAIAGGFGICTLLGIVWVTVLRRRVNQQTREIRVQHEKEARLQAELERTTRLESLGLLAGGIAHDFNNLLTVVMANLSLATLDRQVMAAVGEVLGEAERGAKRAAELTQQLLTFAKGGDPVRAAVSLPDVVREATNFALHGSNVRSELEIADDLPSANVDRAQIGRVVHNLVLNATQAMPNGGVVRVTLTSVTLASGEVLTLGPGRYVKLSVVDDGPGIAPEHLARIFDPYFSTKPKNSGLGLATVHSIVKKHHGHVTVESELGQGTVFHIWLPATDEAPQPLHPRLSMTVGRSAARVLLMDDEESIRQSAAGLLRRLGHEVQLASDGFEALQLYREARNAGTPFDVVVLDLTVPGGMGGKATIESLRVFDPQVRAIVSSGYSSDPVMANYRVYGFAAAVPKPYGLTELGRAIDELMDIAQTSERRFPPLATCRPI